MAKLFRSKCRRSNILASFFHRRPEVGPAIGKENSGQPARRFTGSERDFTQSAQFPSCSVMVADEAAWEARGYE
jgi:hypothetical protein